jgi:serine/threonine-protein kinase 24/25/MST4
MAQNNPHLKSHRRRQSAQITSSRPNSREPSQVWSSSTSGLVTPKPSSSAVSSRSPSKEKRGATSVGGEDEALLTEMKLQGQLEHTRQLADVLFERWCEGMRVRWPGV